MENCNTESAYDSESECESKELLQVAVCKQETEEEGNPHTVVAPNIKTESQDVADDGVEDAACKMELEPIVMSSSLETQDKDGVEEAACKMELEPIVMMSSSLETQDENAEDGTTFLPVKTEVTEEDLHLCKTCDVSFNNYQDFQVHMRVHSDPYCVEEDIKPFMGPIKTELVIHRCEVCKVTFEDESDFEIHFLEHTDSLECRRCHKPFKKKGCLLNHLLMCVGSEDLYKCHVCKKQMNTRQAYEGHMKVHWGDRTFTCNECDKTFTMQHVLDTHIRNIHNNIRPFGCHVCNRSYYSKSYLKKHLMIHTGERPYSCSVCGKTFTQKCSIPKHMQIHTGLFRHNCEFCSKTFKKRSGLIFHLRRVKHTLPFQCDFCTKLFVIRSDFEKHVCVRAQQKNCETIVID